MYTPVELQFTRLLMAARLAFHKKKMIKNNFSVCMEWPENEEAYIQNEISDDIDN